MINEKEKMKQTNEDVTKKEVEETIDTLSTLAYMMLSQESRDQMESLFGKEEEKEENDDWKATALEIMRKVDARQKESEPVMPPSCDKQKIKKSPSAKRLSDEALRQAIIKVTDQEEQQLKEEMKHATPHVFSAEFERKMEELMKVETPKMRAAKCKEKIIGYAQYAIAAVVTVLLLGGLIFSGNKKMTASQMKFCVTQWLENSFVIEEGIDVRQEEGVIFDKSQIGYLPEGFELVSEDITFSKMYFQFENDKGSYIVLKVGRSKASLGIDNNQVDPDKYISILGLEYQFLISEDAESTGVLWSDRDNQVYILLGTITKEEIVNIMDSIVYVGE